jgi:hypothetical protein
MLISLSSSSNGISSARVPEQGRSHREYLYEIISNFEKKAKAEDIFGG